MGTDTGCEGIAAGGLEHPTLAGGAHGAALGQTLAIVGGKVALLVLPTRTAPATVVATEYRNGLLLRAEDQSFEAFAKIHVAISRGQLAAQNAGTLAEGSYSVNYRLSRPIAGKVRVRGPVPSAARPRCCQGLP